MQVAVGCLGEIADIVCAAEPGDLRARDEPVDAGGIDAAIHQRNHGDEPHGLGRSGTREPRRQAGGIDRARQAPAGRAAEHHLGGGGDGVAVGGRHRRRAPRLRHPEHGTKRGILLVRIQVDAHDSPLPCLSMAGRWHKHERGGSA